MLLIVDIAVGSSKDVDFVVEAAKGRVVSTVGLMKIGPFAFTPHSRLDVEEVKTIIDFN